MGAVRARYDERVASGALTGDAAQAGAASRLDALAAALSAPQKRGLFSKPPEPVCHTLRPFRVPVMALTRMRHEIPALVRARAGAHEKR